MFLYHIYSLEKNDAVCVAWLKTALSHCGRDYSKEMNQQEVQWRLFLHCCLASSGLSGYCNCSLELFHQLYLRMSLLRQLVSSNKGTILHIRNVVFFFCRVGFLFLVLFQDSRKWITFILWLFNWPSAFLQINILYL